jgi:hypothetical protein
MDVKEMVNKMNILGKPKMEYSEYTKKYYLTISEVEIKDGGFLTSPVEHKETKEEAITAYYNRLINAPRIVVNAYTDNRKEYIFFEEDFIEYKEFKNKSISLF